MADSIEFILREANLAYVLFLLDVQMGTLLPERPESMDSPAENPSLASSYRSSSCSAHSHLQHSE